jgi:hypothetical protein
MSEFTTIPLEDLYESTLQSDLGATDLSAVVVKAITATLSGGNTAYMGIDYDRPSKYELVEISAISGNTVTIVNRGVQIKAGGTSGTGITHTAGAKVIITHNFKVFSDIADAINSKASGTPTLDGSGAVYVNAAARDAAVTSPQTGQIVTTGGVLQYYSGGIWNDLGVGTSTPNASPTVAGKVEIATQAEATAGTDTGGTGAFLSVVPSNIAVINQNNPQTYATTGGTSTEYTLTLTPAPTAYVAGQSFTMKLHITSGANPTINVNGLGAKNIFDARSLSAIATGSLVANQIVTMWYDGTQFQVVTLPGSTIPTRQIFDTPGTRFGDTTTQFDITNVVGSTYRYTWDGTGTDPNINGGTIAVNDIMDIRSTSFNSNNNGLFVVTGVGANFFDVTNASGVAESNVTIGLLGYIQKGTLYTKPAGITYIEVEVVGGGGASDESGTDNSGSGGGGGGGYSKKLIGATSVGTTEMINIGAGGTYNSINIVRTGAGTSSRFGSHCVANGGVHSSTDAGGAGGTASGGDINVQGGNGHNAEESYSGSEGITRGEMGGASVLGFGGNTEGSSHDGSPGQLYGGGAGGASTPNGGSSNDGADGADGVIIVTEYYN